MTGSIVDRLESGNVLLLDGATGTELARRGLSTDAPEWSARALWEHPRAVYSVHQRYVDAGADVITANTFRTHSRSLRHCNRAGGAGDLTRLAVELARQAAGRRAWVAGSQAPLEDCYSPERVPEEAVLEREHAEMSRNLADAGVDLILVETQNTIREAVAAAGAAASTGVPVMVSFVCDQAGRLLSGETVAAAMEAVAPCKPVAVLTNCLPVHAVGRVLDEMRRTRPDLPIGAYVNTGMVDDQRRWIDTDSVDPNVYAAQARSWLEAGASVIGGCCGTTPEHIARLRRLIDRS